MAKIGKELLAESERARPVVANALHNALLLSGNESYGTPGAYIEIARYVLGRLDLDPASDGYWNSHLVKAGTVYDEALDGLSRVWFGNVFLNAPSNREMGISVRPWWERLFSMWSSGEVEAAIWLGFALPQLTTLQGAPGHPLQFVNMIPRERMDFLVHPRTMLATYDEKIAKAKGAMLDKLVNARSLVEARIAGGDLSPISAGQPTHSNYITLLPTRSSSDAARAMLGRFVERAHDLKLGGAIVRPL